MLLWRSTLSKLGQLPAIRGDQFLFHLTALDTELPDRIPA